MMMMTTMTMMMMKVGFGAARLPGKTSEISRSSISL
jgi:hypothetical protein